MSTAILSDKQKRLLLLLVSYHMDEDSPELYEDVVEPIAQEVESDTLALLNQLGYLRQLEMADGTLFRSGLKTLYIPTLGGIKAATRILAEDGWKKCKTDSENKVHEIVGVLPLVEQELRNMRN